MPSIFHRRLTSLLRPKVNWKKPVIFNSDCVWSIILETEKIYYLYNLGTIKRFTSQKFGIGKPGAERTGHATTINVLFTSEAAMLYCAGAHYGCYQFQIIIFKFLHYKLLFAKFLRQITKSTSTSWIRRTCRARITKSRRWDLIGRWKADTMWTWARAVLA